MPGVANFEGVSEKTGFQLMPDDTYEFEIENVSAKETSKGDPMVNVTLRCISPGFEGKTIFDNIVIPVDSESSAWGIAGRTKHFLHCIGEQYEGQIEWDEANWLFRRVIADIRTKKDSYNPDGKNIVSAYKLPESEKDKSTPFG